jgi:hypothetical protein
LRSFTSFLVHDPFVWLLAIWRLLSGSAWWGSQSRLVTRVPHAIPRVRPRSYPHIID